MPGNRPSPQPFYTFHNSAKARAASVTARFSASACEMPKTSLRGTIGARFFAAISACSSQTADSNLRRRSSGEGERCASMRCPTILYAIREYSTFTLLALYGETRLRTIPCSPGCTLIVSLLALTLKCKRALMLLAGNANLSQRTHRGRLIK